VFVFVFVFVVIWLFFGRENKEKERERRHVNCRILIYCTLGKNSFCRASVERETARRSFVRNVDVAPFHHLSSSSLL